MVRERDTGTPGQGEGRLLPASLERAFHTQKPATIVLFDVTHYGSVDPRQSMWNLVHKYAPLFGSKGELTVGSRTDIYDLSAFERELQQYGKESDTDRMRFIRQDEAQYMARILFSPPTEPQQIQDRQELLEQLAISEQLDELIRLKNGAYGVLEGVGKFNAGYSKHVSDDRSLIKMLYDGETTVEVYDYYYAPPNFYDHKENLMPHVNTATGDIARGMKALHALTEHQEPAVRAVFGEIPTFTAQVQQELALFLPPDILKGGVEREYPFFPDHENFSKWHDKNKTPYVEYDPLRELQSDILEPYLLRMGAALELAKKIRDESWGKVSFDPEKPVGYQQGWNLEKSKNSQVRNDSPEDAPIVLLSGANTSGKSFAMKSDFLIRIAGQSLGFAPAQAANLRPYESFIYLERGATDSSNDLSAFMREVQNWKLALPAIGAHSRLYVDEGYSTTSPQDQARLLFATAEYVKRNGGSVMLATHNDMVLDAAGGNPDMQTYHLAAEVDANGELVRHFRLEPGRSESLSFVVARMKDFPEGALSWAEGYLRRDSSLPVAMVANDYPTIEQFTTEERERRKAEVQSLQHLFPARPVNPVFRLLSIDPDFQIEGFFQHATHSREEKVMDFLSVRTQKELLGKMVVWSSELTPTEVLERQRLIGELLKEGAQQKVHEAIAQAAALDGTFATLKRAVKEGLNQGLNPFQEMPSERGSWGMDAEPSNPPFSSGGLQDAIAFLRILEKVSGAELQYGHLLSQFTSLASIYEQASKRVGKDKIWRGTELAENEKILLLLSTEGEEREALAAVPATIAHLDSTVEKLFGRLQAIGKDLPPIPFESINIDEIKGELEALKERGVVAAALVALPENLEKARSLIALFRTTDSVYLHQTANFLEQQVDKNVAILNGKEVEETALTNEPTQDDRAPRFDHIGRRGSEGQRQERSPYGETLQQLDALCLFADIAQHEGFTPVQFNTTGEVQFREGFSLFKKKREEVKNTVSLNAGSERVQFLTGPNGSGKTFYEKGAVASVLMGLATGYAPAEYATMPVFDGVAYLDRVVERQGDEFSAFSQEVEYWKQLLSLLGTKKSVFAAVDEAFSTTSPSYQAAFTYGVVSEFLQSPHFLLLSTHNHDVVNHLEDSQVSLVNPYHFQFSTENGRVQYQYKLKEGHETSRAVEVARTMGLPEEIVSAAQKVNELLG